MIDAKYLETLREANRNLGVGGEVIVNVGMFDELCRVYLAWLDAPICRAGYYSTPPMQAVTGVYFTDPEIKQMAGKYVRLMEVKDG